MSAPTTPRSAQPLRQDAASLKPFIRMADRARASKKFRALVDELHTIVPYRHFVCTWGYFPGYQIGFIYNHSMPETFLRWSLTKGLIRSSPMVREWFRTRRIQIYPDVASRYADRFIPGEQDKIMEAHLQYSMLGGWRGSGLFVLIIIAMLSEEACRDSVKPFRLLLPHLCKALTRSRPRPLLTLRETVIFQRRALGESVKFIAAEERVSQRTVRMHLERGKKKLFTHDLVNAIVMAAKSGMLCHPVKAARSSEALR